MILGSLIFVVCHVSVSDLAVAPDPCEIFMFFKMLRLWMKDMLTSLPAFPGGPAGPRGPIGPCYEYKHDYLWQASE